MGQKQISSLLERDIHVWKILIDEFTDQLHNFYKILSLQEREKAARFKFKKDKTVYTIARGALRMLLSSYLNAKPEEIQFGYTKYGKPYLKGAATLKFNVSHSESMIVIAFSQHQEIGVDVEKIKNNFDVLELAQNFFSKTEIVALEQQSKNDLPQAFFRCWTRKESFIKAEGSGLSFPLDQFAVSLDNDLNAQLLEAQWDTSEVAEWSLYSFVPKDKYIGALAIRAKVDCVIYKNYTPSF